MITSGDVVALNINPLWYGGFFIAENIAIMGVSFGASGVVAV